jgi:predicted ABC-type ATPase
VRPASPPLLTVVAGPNGAGKSTLTRLQLAATAAPVLDPDARARLLDPDNPARAAIAASRHVLTQSQLFIDTLTSFVLETTMSGHTALTTMLHAHTAGFTVDLLYVCLSSVEGHRARIAARVAQGGHDVPDQDVRRRYARSLANLPRALALSDHALIFDNSAISCCWSGLTATLSPVRRRCHTGCRITWATCLGRCRDLGSLVPREPYAHGAIDRAEANRRFDGEWQAAMHLYYHAVAYPYS